MTILTKLPLVALVLALPASSVAQSGGATYCTALATKYQRYVNSNDRHYRQATPPTDVSVAMSKCQSDWASSIPVLERALQAARVDLPPHG